MQPSDTLVNVSVWSGERQGVGRHVVRLNADTQSNCASSQKQTSCECRGVKYNADDQVCCGDKLHERPPVAFACCSTELYDTTTQKCCFRNIISKNEICPKFRVE
ncbi:hypothetical protein LSAT2_016374 [Lamellibrachia satsuma]|nr:hypothetical protein LSAT2_016374 [Lamellibrachia satsuma]